ncbi:MAG: AEC family transporter, partial [Pseudomonadota bacterium]
MTLALTVLQIVAPVFVLAAIGFAWVKAGYAYDTAFVTRLAMTLAVPALIFSALADTALDPAAVARVAWATLLAYGAV